MCCVAQQERGFPITATRKSSSTMACTQHAHDAVLLQLNMTTAMLPGDMPTRIVTSLASVLLLLCFLL
jgi:hypothetical protein